MFLVLWLILAGGGRLLTRVLELSSIDVGIEYMVPILQATYWLGYFISGYLLYKRKDELKQKLSTPLLAAAFIGATVMITGLTYMDSMLAEDFQDPFLTYGELFMMLSSTSFFLLNTRFKAKEHRLFKLVWPADIRSLFGPSRLHRHCQGTDPLSLGKRIVHPAAPCLDHIGQRDHRVDHGEASWTSRRSCHEKNGYLYSL